MRPSFRTFLYLFPLALAAATLYLVVRANLTQLHQGLLTDPELLKALQQSVEEELRLAERRWEAKRQVICALIDGRLTLRKAAAQFRDIDVGIPLKAQAQRPPQYSEEEWACCQVIAFVHGELASIRQAPAQAEEWVARLEMELQEHLRHDGAAPPVVEP
jgi:hypothetical protein